MPASPIARATGLASLLISLAGQTSVRAEEMGPPADAQLLVEAAELAQESARFAAAARGRLDMGVTCYPERLKGDPSAVNHFLPAGAPRLFDPERFWTDANVWVGNIALGPSARNRQFFLRFQ